MTTSITARAALRRAWTTLGRDPVRLGGAAIGCLAVDAITGWALARCILGSQSLLGVVCIFGLRAVARTPWRVALVAWGEHARSGRELRWLRRLPAAWAAETVASAWVWTFGLVVASPLCMLTLWLAAQGAVIGAIAVGVLTLLVATIAGWTQRARTAFALIHVVRDGLGAPHALRRAFTAPSPQRHFTLRVCASGDLLRGVGALLFVAGALPAYPLEPLALLEHGRS